jgi:hypothetical protein
MNNPLSQTVTIAGHKVPIGDLVVAGGGLLGVFLLIRAQHSGGVVGIGAQPPTDASTTVGSSQDVLQAFGQLESEIGGLQNRLDQLQSAGHVTHGRGGGGGKGGGGGWWFGPHPEPPPIYWRDGVDQSPPNPPGPRGNDSVGAFSSIESAAQLAGTWSRQTGVSGLSEKDF